MTVIDINGRTIFDFYTGQPHVFPFVKNYAYLRKGDVADVQNGREYSEHSVGKSGRWMLTARMTLV